MPRLKFAIPNSPLVVPIDMALQWQPLGPADPPAAMARRFRHRRNAPRHGAAQPAELAAGASLPERLLIIGGAGDRFTAPSFVNLLHRHWAGSRLHWFPGNHVLHLQQGQYLRLMKRFMDQATADNV